VKWLAAAIVLAAVIIAVALIATRGPSAEEKCRESGGEWTSEGVCFHMPMVPIAPVNPTSVWSPPPPAEPHSAIGCQVAGGTWIAQPSSYPYHGVCVNYG
jgi:hypothetical protein